MIYLPTVQFHSLLSLKPPFSFIHEMNPCGDLPQHGSIFFLLVVVLLFTITVGGAGSDDRFTNCSSRFSCGIVTDDVGYPFWGYNRADYCGQPGFQLDCQDNTPKLIFNSITYRILNFSLHDQSLTVARDDYWDNICSDQYGNTSFDSSTMFKLDDGFSYMAFLYNCSNSFNPTVGLVNSSTTECPTSSGATQNIYYVIVSSINIDLTGICRVVVVPIMNTYVGLVVSGQRRIEEAMKEGFGLRWSVDNNEECNNCVNSGGQCGYSDQNFTCFCSNGLQGTSCSSDNNEECNNCVNSGGQCGYGDHNFTCTCSNGLQGNTCSSGKSSNKTTIAIASASGVGMVMVILIAIICYRSSISFRLRKKTSMERRTYDDHHVETFKETYGNLAPRKYTYSEVRRITKSFTAKIGEGGYGIVYKGILPDGRLVAVKVLNETKGNNNGEEFINEVASISRTSHVNIVSLLGFCYEKNTRALVYEFMPNGALDKFIYKGEYSLNPICDFEWRRLHRISINIARGLEYLHHGCNTRILHLDIKPQNILLDEDFCPKISDFGLAKICYKKESIVSILGMRGTAGYIAPEVFSRTYGGVSYKSDVYSYGMLILEMIGGRKNFESGGSHSNSDMYFPNWIYKELEQSNNVVATNVSITEEENEVVRKLSLVGLWCIQTNPANRPSMSKVVEMLEGASESLSFPPKPSLSSPPRTVPLHFSDDSSSIMIHSNPTMPIPMETST